jgi:hypothetical protein
LDSAIDYVSNAPGRIRSAAWKYTIYFIQAEAFGLASSRCGGNLKAATRPLALPAALSHRNSYHVTEERLDRTADLRMPAYRDR